MHDRLATPRWMFLVLLVGLLTAVPLSAVAGAKNGPPANVRIGATPSETDAKPTFTAPSYMRETPWWPFATGPSYGWSTSETAIVTRVGSFDPALGEKLDIPTALTADLRGFGQGRHQYFLVQVTPSALNDALTETLASMGVTVVDRNPHNALTVRLDSRAYGQLSSSPIITSIEPYHPAFKLDPAIGRLPRLTREEAASSVMPLTLALFAGEPVQPVVEAAAQLGAVIRGAWQETQTLSFIELDIDVRQIPELAKLTPVALISERQASRMLAFRGSLYLQSETATAGDYPYWKVGLQGDDVIVQVTDSGLSVDAGDHTNTKGVSGWNGDGTDNVVANHRKVRRYRSASDFGGSGNLLGCDIVANGGFTHGQIVTGVVLGNATRGYVPAPTNPNPTDGTTSWNPNQTWVTPYGGNGWWIDNLPQDGLFSETLDQAFDGIAKGAKVLFIDAASLCPEEANPSLSPGNLQNTIQQTWLTYRAAIHNFSFGTDPAPSGPVYDSQAQQIDAAIYGYPVNDVTIACGNLGSTGNQGSSATPGNTSNTSTCKNCISVGGSSGVGGSIWSFTSEGPGPTLRHVVLVLGEGADNACRSDEGTEDQTGASTCVDTGTFFGTSFAAPNIAGAAAVIREYFREGFYPDGTNANPNNSNEKVSWISSRLVRALLIAGAKPIAGGKTYVSKHRLNHIWGFGQFFLNRALPLADYTSKTVAGLIVSDEPGDLNGDGTADGVSSVPGMADTIPTSSGSSTSAEFLLADTKQDLVVALTWDDPQNASGAVDNDLDLEVTYCGWDQNCDATADNLTWLGNVFTEDIDEDATQDGTEPDINGDGSVSAYWYSISNKDITNGGGTAGTPDNYRNRMDNFEAVFIATKNNAPDLDTNGTIDIRYLDDVNNDHTGCTQAAPCPRTGKWKVTVKRYDGTTAMRYALAIAGQVSNGSTIGWDTNPVSCNGDENLVVTEMDDAADTGCTLASCPVGTIKNRTTVEVLNTGGTVVDTEAGASSSGIVFKNQPAGTLRFELTNRLPLTTVTTPTNNDGILSVQNGYRLRAKYADVTASGTQTRTSDANVDCQPAVDLWTIEQLGPDTAFILAGGCDPDRYLDEDEQFGITVQVFNADPFELVDATATLNVYDGDGTTTTPSTYVTVPQPTKSLGNLLTNYLQQVSFAFKVNGEPTGRRKTTFEVCVSSAKAGQPVGSCTRWLMLLQADDDKRFYITDCPTGCGSVGTPVKFDRNNDEKLETLITNNPYFDPLNHENRNLSEYVVYENLTDTSFGYGNPGFNGPWNFESGKQGFTTGHDAFSKKGSGTGAVIPTNWGEDSNWNDALDVALGEDVDTDGTLDQNWGAAGGCGWMSKGTGTTGGAWHTGTIGAWTTSHRTTMCGGTTSRANDTICEQYDTEAGTIGENYWWEALRSPVVRPVHFGNASGDGYDWKTQILDWAWNMQLDIADDNAQATWEFDLDTLQGNPTVLGDIYVQNVFGVSSGLVTGGQLELYQGGMAWQDTCRVSGGCAQSWGTAGYGDGISGTVGNNREGVRGCFFNDLNRITDAVFRPVHLPFDDDDDCDNDWQLGANGCPGNCGVDDDSNNLIDDPGEICPCKKCSGGPRANIPCFVQSYCNPSGGTTYLCANATTAGKPTAYGDDTCGDGTVDEYVFASFGTSTANARQRRNADLSMINGIADIGRGGGEIAYTNLEDFYGPAGSNWQTELGFIVMEPMGTTAAVQGYGIAIDDMVIEWQETHPTAQGSTTKCATGNAYFDENGQCAQLTAGSATHIGYADIVVPVSVVDPFPNLNLGECSVGSTQGIKVTAYSVAELTGETICLTPVATGSSEYGGTVKITTRVNRSGDGYVYVAYDGGLGPSVTVRYIDKDDGVLAHRWEDGADNQPGIAGYDDDGDGTVDNASEQCSDRTSFAQGRSPHLPGTPARWSDDKCGCPDNPILFGIATYFDAVDMVVSDVRYRDGIGGVGVGDGDGYPDPGERVVVDVRVRNMSNFAVENVELGFATDSAVVECVTDDRIRFNRIEKADPGSNLDEYDTASGSDHFEFIPAYFSNTAQQRQNPGDDYGSQWTVTVRGLAKASTETSFNVDLPVDGTAVVQRSKVQHNLDLPTVSRAVDFFDNFESYTNDQQVVCTPAAGASTCNPTGGTASINWWYVKRSTGDDSAELRTTHCQTNSPTNPQGNNADPADYCELGEGYSITENHWHLMGPKPSQGTVCELSSGCPGLDSSGRGHSGSKSISSGDFPSATKRIPPYDNYVTLPANRMYWLKMKGNIQLGVGGVLNGGGSAPAQCNSSPGSCAEQAPVLEYWTQMSNYDHRFFGYLTPFAWDAALVYVCVDKNNNNDCDTAEDGLKNSSEVWKPIRSYYSPSQQYRLNNFINCMYDPSDDGSDETQFFNGLTRLGPSSTCFPYTSDACVGRTANSGSGSGLIDPYYFSITPDCWPETGQEGLEGETGTGAGKWIKKMYNLKEFSGQKVLFRWHVAPGAYKAVSSCGASYLGCGNVDDGWYIDDLRVYGRASAFALSNENAKNYNETCPTSPVSNLVARLAAIEYPRNWPDGTPKKASACSHPTATYCDFNTDGTADTGSDTTTSGAPARPYVLDARNSTADACLRGALEYRFEDQTAAVLRDWLTETTLVVNPTASTTYTVKVRCSSDTSPTPTIATDTVTINMPGGGGCTITGQLLLTHTGNWSGTTTLTWTGANGPWDVARGDAATMQGSGSFSGATCNENNSTDTTSTHAYGSQPTAGSGLYFLVRCDGGTWNDGQQSGNRDTSLTTCQ